jgi:hypothetical protein
MAAKKTALEHVRRDNAAWQWAESSMGFAEDHPDSKTAGALAIANAILAVGIELRGVRDALNRLPVGM